MGASTFAGRRRDGARALFTARVRRPTNCSRAAAHPLRAKASHKRGSMEPNLRRQALADTLRRRAVRYPERLGLICGATRWTYSEFHALSGRLAARGIQRGDGVAILARNSHGFAALRYGLMRLGAVMVP